MKSKNNANYNQLKLKIFIRILSMMFIAFISIFILYSVIWKEQGGDWIVLVFQKVFGLDYEQSMNIYQQIFRNNVDMVWLIAIIIVFCIFCVFFINWFAKYFNAINKGIDGLLDEDLVIKLPTEMLVVEKKLNTVKETLRKRTQEAELAEQRKNDLVMYLAHDIKTPLTSVIGYLNLIKDAPDMTTEQRAKYVDITLDKAYRLEKMINEFFEITRLNTQYIKVEKEEIDLYYMFVQLVDELTPIFSSNCNDAIIQIDENTTVLADPNTLARVFNNILKNATAYSYPNTKLIISAIEADKEVVVSVKNKGETIAKENLEFIFDKFYRMDDARTSNTGGTGLGLAISKEIMRQHGGDIVAESENNTVTISVTLPKQL